MGALNSKVFPSGQNAPEHDKDSFSDPRSPTLYINRSPISQEAGASHPSITKVKDLTSVLMESSAVLQTPINLLPKRLQSIIDPRSPGTFTRTPLIVCTESPGDCSLTNVVTSLHYEECNNAGDDSQDESFKDCIPPVTDLCNLQIESNESEPIIDPPTDDGKEVTIFEDSEVVPFAGNDPRSPSIAIARTPMVLVDDEKDLEERDNTQVVTVQGLEGILKEEAEKLHRTPSSQEIVQGQWGEQTPKKDKLTPSGAKVGNRTPLGCVTNTGTASNKIRKMALIGQIKQNMNVDEQKLLSNSDSAVSAELKSSIKQTNLSRIPKFRMS